jgi:glycoside/pentoside/hexuronide:cation symporter, GPH family
MNISISALVPELTDDYDERTSLSSYRLAIGNLSAFGSLMVMTQMLSTYSASEKVEGYRNSALVVAIIMATFGLVCFAFIREKFKMTLEENVNSVKVPQSPKPISKRKKSYDEMIEENDGLNSADVRVNRKLKDEIKLVLENKAFLWLAGIWLCGPTALFVLQSSLVLYCKYILNDETLITMIILIVQGCSFASLPFWLKLSKAKGKRFAYNCAAVGLMVFTSLLTFNSNLLFGYICACGIGLNLIVVYLIPYSMLPDCIEEDEYRTGRRREGIYVGFFGFMMKISVTLAMGFTNVLLKIVGYQAPVETCGLGVDEGAEEDEVDNNGELPASQNDATRKVIRFLVGVGPACFFAIALLCVSRYPITKDYHDNLLRKIQEKKKLGMSNAPGSVQVLRSKSQEEERNGGRGIERDDFGVNTTAVTLKFDEKQL